MGALLSQLFCFPTSLGHFFLTPDFSFTSLCSLRACILAPWVLDTASPALPSCSLPSPACKLCWHYPDLLVALPWTKASLLSFLVFLWHKRRPKWGISVMSSTFFPAVSSEFQSLLKNMVSRWLPAPLQRRRIQLHPSFKAAFQQVVEHRAFYAALICLIQMGEISEGILWVFLKNLSTVSPYFPGKQAIIQKYKAEKNLCLVVTPGEQGAHCVLFQPWPSVMLCHSSKPP